MNKFPSSPGPTLNPTSLPEEAVPLARPIHYPDMGWNLDFEVERRLPREGEILVAAGQRVEGDTLIARTSLPGRPRLFNLAGHFNTGPEEISRLLVKEVGQEVAEGEVIARPKGFFGIQFKAPFSGVIAGFDPATGYLNLSPAPTPFSLDAYVQGHVTEIIPGFGAKIGLRAGYIRGAFGLGGEQHGVLRALATDPGEPVLPGQIEARANSLILLGGSFITTEALRRAVETKVRGIICGSIQEAELNKFLEYRQRTTFYRVGSHNGRFPADLSPVSCPFTLVITEGFGEHPMAAPIFELLLGQEDHLLSLNGTTRLGPGGRRPEIIIPIKLASEVAKPPVSLDPAQQAPRTGSIVRLTNPGYLGMVGKIRSLPTSRRGGQPSGMVEVEVNESRVFVPLTNLEILQ